MKRIYRYPNDSIHMEANDVRTALLVLSVEKKNTTNAGMSSILHWGTILLCVYPHC